jgi:hypothetical protein
MPLLLGEEAFPISHEQSKVAGASHVYARKINFIQDSVAQGKPNSAAAAERSSDAGFRA